MEDFTAISSSHPLSNFCRLAKEEMTLMGTSVIKGTAQNRAIMHKIDELSRDIERLSLLHSHSALEHLTAVTTLCYHSLTLLRFEVYRARRRA